MPTYDPNKSYSWKPNDKFEITGDEFGLFLQAVKTVLSTPEASKVLLFQRLNASLEATIAKAVEAGTIFETPQETISEKESQ